MGYFNLGHGFAYEAKIKIILHSLLFCKQFLFRNIIIENDSKVAVGWVILNTLDLRPFELLNELNQIDSLLGEVNYLGVKYVYRETNIVDYLAKVELFVTNPLWVCIANSFV